MATRVVLNHLHVYILYVCLHANCMGQFDVSIVDKVIEWMVTFVLESRKSNLYTITVSVQVYQLCHIRELLCSRLRHGHGSCLAVRSLVATRILRMLLNLL